jgi:amidase
MKREALRRDYHALMKDRGADVILCPSYVGAGVLLGEPRCWRYTAMWNVLDQPCISFPSGTQVDKAIDSPDESHTPRSEEDEREGRACE